MKKRILWLLCAAMLAGLLPGCGAAAGAEAYVDVEETPAVTESESSADFSAALQKALGKYDGGAVVMTINGRAITWDLYAYWLSRLLDTYHSVLGELPKDFSAVFSQGESLDEFLINSTDRYVIYYAALSTWAEKLGIEPESDAALQEAWAEECGQNGGEEAYLETLETDFVTKNAWMYYARGDDLYRKLLAAQYGENGEKITQEEAESWAQKNDYVHVNDIVLLTKNANGDEMNDTDKAAVLARAEQLLSELRAVQGEPEALEEKFDALRNENSEDSGPENFPDGYTITKNQTETAFETAAFELGEYELSDIVETSGGYHILLGLPIRTDAVMGENEDGEPYTVAVAVRRDAFEAEMDDRIGEAVIVWSDEFDDFSVGSLFA